jgi:hypothetical protein
MQQVAIFVHFIRQKSFSPSPTFNHTQCPQKPNGRKMDDRNMPVTGVLHFSVTDLPVICSDQFSQKLK